MTNLSINYKTQYITQTTQIRGHTKLNTQRSHIAHSTQHTAHSTKLVLSKDGKIHHTASAQQRWLHIINNKPLMTCYTQ